MLKKKLSAPNIDGKHNMTGLELSEADDLATMMTVDAVLGITTHKMDKNFNPHSIDKKLKEKWKSIMQEFINECNYDNTYQQLIANDKVKAHWKKDERFKRHIFRFLYLFDKRSGIEVRPCFRYENEGKVGAAIYASKEWDKNCQITTLFGCIAEIRSKDEDYFREHKNEFSVMFSTRKNCSQLWLGPAAYVNHDCKPNCRFTEGNDDTKMLLETLRDIQPGDELLIYYGQNFFGPDNAECECFTCELKGRGFFIRNIIDSNFSTDVNNNQEDDKSRRIITRSHGKFPNIQTNINHELNDNIKLSSLTNNRSLSVHNWKKTANTNYSFRVTYSRIDRVKKSILTLNESQKSTLNVQYKKSKIVPSKPPPPPSTPTPTHPPHLPSLNDKSNCLKRKSQFDHRIIGTRSTTMKKKKQKTDNKNKKKKNNDDDCIIIKDDLPDRRSLRHNSGNGEDNNLKLIFRKNNKNGGKYGVVDSSDSNSNDRNIFNCINSEYFSDNLPPPQLTLSLSPKPPNLSPWFYNYNNKIRLRNRRHRRHRNNTKLSSRHKITQPKPPILTENNNVDDDDDDDDDDPPQILRIINLTTQPIIVDNCSSNSSSCCITKSTTTRNATKQLQQLKPPPLELEESSSSIESSSLLTPFDDCNNNSRTPPPQLLCQ